MLIVDNLQVSSETSQSRTLLINGISFTIDRGEVVGLIGPSGCGKSMTALALLNLLPPGIHKHARKLMLDGLTLTHLSEKEWRHIRGHQLALIFQHPRAAFDPLMRVGAFLQNVWARHFPESKAARLRRLYENLERVGLTPSQEIARLYPHEMSGGMLQRAMIALALGCEPKLLIADEPSSNLDLITQNEILALLRDIQRERNLAMLLITHDFAALEFLAHRVLVMEAGKIVETGAVEQLLIAPQSDLARELVRAVS